MSLSGTPKGAQLSINDTSNLHVCSCLYGLAAEMPTCFVQELSSKLTNQLTDLTSMVRRDLGGEARKKVNTLIITDVHARDIIETFVRDSVMDAREFAWESQLRFYWDRTADDLMIRQCTGQSVDRDSL